MLFFSVIFAFWQKNVSRFILEFNLILKGKNPLFYTSLKSKTNKKNDWTGFREYQPFVVFLFCFDLELFPVFLTCLDWMLDRWMRVLALHLEPHPVMHQFYPNQNEAWFDLMMTHQLLSQPCWKEVASWIKVNSTSSLAQLKSAICTRGYEGLLLKYP